MECPRCRNKELGPDGICPACHYAAERREGGAESPAAGARPAQGGEEMPPWRQALIQRLESLKHGNQQEANTGAPERGTALPPPPRILRSSVAKPPEPPPLRHAGIPPPEPRPEAKPPSPAPRAKAPQQLTIAQPADTAPQAPRPAGAASIRELIDSAVSRQSAPTPEDSPFIRPELPIDPDSKYILLSRTLAGLVDLIFVVLCTAALILAADSFSGIVVLDRVSVIEFALLFLLVFFQYSVFFLATSGQTVGMMITDLRITGIAGSRPSIGQLFARCFGFLVSLLVLGAGLLWSLFDRKNRCFHDRLSDTSVVRL